MSKVNFSLDTFVNDPPQQIPARKPREGTVTVDEDKGVISRNHKTTNTSIPMPENYQHFAETASQAAYKCAQQISQAVASERHEKKLHLPRLGRTLSNSKINTMSASNDHSALEDLQEEEEGDEEGCCKEDDLATGSSFLTGAEIDKDNAKKLSNTDADTADSSAANPKKKTKKFSRELTDVYTRCCHLREIMPIKATLRQLEGYTGTLPFLRLLNPRPTMIEVMAFSDFISMVPINTIVLNRIDISDEMFRQIILSLCSSAASALSKLCLKNVNISPESWKLFCAFLVHNKSLTKLDISLTTQPSASTNFKYYEFDIYDRSKLDWDLFTKALVARGGMEELILNRCLIPHEQFDRLIRDACCIATKRLGVASSDLQFEDLKSLVSWTTETSFVKEGIDLGGNDLAKNYLLIQDLFSQSSLKCLSINSCNLNDSKGMQAMMPEKFITTSEMRFIDFSFNPGLFPDFADFLGPSLHLFPILRRLHLNYCGLTSESIITLAEGFAKCKHLFHVSLVGNTDINPAAAEALAAAVKMSNTITCVEVDEGIIPANILKRLNHYCMQNMESMVDIGVDEDDYLIDNGKGLADAIKYVVDANQKSELSERSLLMADSLTQRAKVVREKVQKRLENLISHHKSGAATGKSSEESNRSFKDSLIIFYYLETTLGRVLNNYDSITGSSASKRHPLRLVDRAESTAAGAGDSNNTATIKKLAGESEYLPKPPSGDAQYHVGEDGEIQLLRSAGLTNEENTLRQQQAREEGDFHKLTTFIRRTKPSLTGGDVDVSGEELRKILLREESTTPTNGKEPNSQDHSAVTPADVAAESSEKPLVQEEEGDLTLLMDRLNKMSDEEIQDYIRERYGIEKKDDTSD